MQRGFLTVVSPIQEGANKALKPVRDLFSWFGDTLHAERPARGSAQAEGQTAQGSDRRARRRARLPRTAGPLPPRPAQPEQLPPGDRHGRRQVAEPLVLDDLDRQGHLLGSAEKRPGRQRRRARRQGRAGRVRRRRGRSDHRQRSRRLRADQRHERDRHGAAEGGRTERSRAAVPAGRNPGQPRRKRRHLRDGRTSGLLAVPAGDPDRAGELGRRRKRVQVGQRASAGRPAQPQRRAGAHVYAGQQAGAAGQPPVGFSGSRTEQHHRRQRRQSAHLGLDERRQRR